jgi:hypothetical protein
MKRSIAALLVLVLLGAGAEAGDKVADLAPRAREQARLWQADAQLVQIEATAGEDGTLSGASTPRHWATFHFLSPSLGHGLAVVAGGPQLETQPWQTRERYAGPIPDRFTDLSAGVAEGRKHGLRGPMIVAKLRLYPRALDQPPRAYWSISGSGAPGSPGLTMYIDAETGALARIAEPVGPAPRGRQSALLPDTTGFDLDALRQVADRTAAGERPGFKLFAILLQLAHDEFLNRRAAAQDVPLGFAQARFHYFRETPPYWWESLEIEIQRAPPKPAWATRHTVPQTRPLLAEVAFSPARKAEGFWTPQAVPADLPPPQAALERLQRAFYARQVSQGGKAEVWLWRSGDPYRPVQHGPREDWHAVFTASVPPGRWFWWTVVDHIGASEQQRTSRTHRPGYYEFIFIDARTGAETVTCTAPQAVLTGYQKPLVATPCPPQ